MEASTPAFPVLHYLPEFAQDHTTMVEFYWFAQKVCSDFSVTYSGKTPMKFSANPTY